VANGPNIFQMLLVMIFIVSSAFSIQSSQFVDMAFTASRRQILMFLHQTNSLFYLHSVDGGSTLLAVLSICFLDPIESLFGPPCSIVKFTIFIHDVEGSSVL